VETYLRSLIGPKVLVKLTDNRSTVISFQWRRSVLYLRLHRCFGAAPPPVLKALAAFCGVGRWTPAKSRLLDRYVDGAAEAPTRAGRSPGPLRAQGAVHDLQTIFDRLNADCFGGRIDARITWGTARRGRRRSIRLGSYIDDLRLIRIHPALDQAFVPAWYVAAVVHHEMLHQVHGIERDASGRRQIHSPAFRAEERRYPDHQRAKAWEAAHIGRLLRS
jgi:hypothetical protein